MKNLLTLLAFGAATLTAAAQAVPAFKSSCDEHKYNYSDNKQYCETRDFSLKAPKSGPLTVDGDRNGGISVRSYAGSEVKVRARIQTWGADEATAKATASSVHVNTVDGTMRATSTGGDKWAVSYELLVPEKMALALKTQNGGISLDGGKGPVTFEAQNGGVSIVGTGGRRERQHQERGPEHHAQWPEVGRQGPRRDDYQRGHQLENSGRLLRRAIQQHRPRPHQHRLPDGRQGQGRPGNSRGPGQRRLPDSRRHHQRRHHH